MNTFFQSPSSIIQTSDDNQAVYWLNADQISTADSNILHPNDSTAAGFFSTTNQEIYRIAMRDSKVRTNSVNQIICTNFKFSNIGIVTGIELRLVAQRLARIQDYVISLTYRGDIIGENKANDFASNDQIYGSSTDMWGEVLSNNQIEDESFGVVIGLGPNKKTPHSDAGYINSVQLKVYFD